jgi:tetratricopeptide (TPR) repeat protein
MYPAFLEAHGQAVALAGLTPELRSDRGHGLHIFEHKMAEAEAELLQSKREKQWLPTYIRLTMLYAAAGRLDEALDVLAEAHAVDPLAPMLPATETNIRFCRREFDHAVVCGKKALELHPYLQFARVFYAQALEYAGKVEEACEQYRLAGILSPDLPWLRALEATCLARHGGRKQASRILHEMEKARATEYVDAHHGYGPEDGFPTARSAVRTLAAQPLRPRRVSSKPPLSRVGLFGAQVRQNRGQLRIVVRSDRRGVPPITAIGELH